MKLSRSMPIITYARAQKASTDGIASKVSVKRSLVVSAVIDNNFFNSGIATDLKIFVNGNIIRCWRTIRYDYHKNVPVRLTLQTICANCTSDIVIAEINCFIAAVLQKIFFTWNRFEFLTK